MDDKLDESLTVSQLDTHVGYWLRFVSNHVSASFQKKLAHEGITVSEWVMLREIYRLQKVSPSTLQQATGMTQGAVSKLLTRLQKKDFIIQTVSEKDQRNHLIEITHKGEILLPILSELADKNDLQFFGHLTSEKREEIKKLMKEIVNLHNFKNVPIE